VVGLNMSSELFIFGERFEVRRSRSLIVDFDKKIVELDPEKPNHLRRLERVLRGRLFFELESLVQEYAKKLGVKFNRITIRKQRSRWGSCSINGNLNFNLRLISLPKHLIRYIAWHEVAHLREKNHGRRFRELMRNEFGNFQELDRSLRKYWHLVERSDLLSKVQVLQ